MLVSARVLVIVALSFIAANVHALDPPYSELKQSISVEQRSVRRAGRRLRRGRAKPLERLLLGRIDALSRAWLGTRWGLGMPQTQSPGVGKVNCGLFVALVLKHAGFNLPIWKFNRQAARDAILSVAPRKYVRYFHRAPMPRFIADVKRMGPGLFLIGLDFHIGFLRLDKAGRLRFIHASYVTKKVVDEPADRAVPIVKSRYRLVGKILQPNMLRSWLSGRRIHIRGSR